MTSDRFAQLKPPAIISTIGSLPRRFGEAFVPAPTADPDEVAALVGDDGRSMLDLVASATAAVKSAHQAVDPSANIAAASGGTRTSELAGLETATDQLAAALKELSGKDWGRTVSAASGDAATIEEVGQAAARAAITELSNAEALAKTF